MRISRWVAALAAAALSVSLFAAPTGDKKKGTTTKTTTTAADKGAELYKAKCASCHSADGSGDSVMGKKLGAKPFKDDAIVKMSDDDLFKAIKSGKGKMPAYDKKITDDQIKDLVKHIRTLQGEKPKTTEKPKTPAKTTPPPKK